MRKIAGKLGSIRRGVGIDPCVDVWQQEEHLEQSTCDREHCARALGGSDDRKRVAAWVRIRRSVAAPGSRHAAPTSGPPFCRFASGLVADPMARRQ